MDVTEFSYSRTVARDAEEHADGLSAWNQTYQQLTAGVFNAALEDLRVGGVQVFRERADRRVLQQGAARRGTVTIGVTQSGTGPGWYCGHRLEGRQMIGLSSQDEFELVTGENMDVVAICVDTTQLAALATKARGREFEFDLPRPAVLDAPTTGSGELMGLVDSVMTLAREHPARLGHAAARRMLSYSLTEAVLDHIAPLRQSAEPSPGSAARRRIVATARDYMRTHSEDAIAVAELCAVTSASRRALQYAFEDVLNVSPLSYLRAMRLNGVRHALREPGCDTVGDVAARWGFWHLSRFAGEYRQMFGELPSATRARNERRGGSLAPSQTARRAPAKL